MTQYNLRTGKCVIPLEAPYTLPGERINPNYMVIGREKRIPVTVIGKVYKYIERNVCLKSDISISAFGNTTVCRKRGNAYHKM